MVLRNCNRCGKLFEAVSARMTICPECEQADELDFEKVKEFIAEHPTANVIEVTKGTGVARKRIYEWIRSGRLNAGGFHSHLTVECESCGAPISSGRLCKECSARLRREAEKVLGKDKKPEKEGERAGFHLADRLMRRDR